MSSVRILTRAQKYTDYYFLLVSDQIMEWTSGFMDFRFLFQKGSNCHPLTNSIHADKVKTSQKLKHTIFLQGKESHIFLLSLTLLSEKNLIQILLLQGRGSLKDADKLLVFFEAGTLEVRSTPAVALPVQGTHQIRSFLCLCSMSCFSHI